MKRIVFSRKAILRAIHAACVALYFAAAAARAQTATADGSGNVTITGSGTGYVYSGTNPTLTPGGNLTVTTGSTITDSSIHAIIDLSEGADISNLGDLTISGSSSSHTIGSIFTTGGAQATTITNSGSLSAVASISNSGYGAFGILYNDLYSNNVGSSAPVTVTNSGSVYGAGGPGADAVNVFSNGPVSVTNTGTMSSANTVDAYALAFHSRNASGTANNSGTITAQGLNAIAFYVTALDDLTVTNSGTVQAAATQYGYGILGASTNGDILVTNSGSITASGGVTGASGVAGIDIFATGGTITIANSGSITASSDATGTTSGIYAKNSGAGDVSITNSASGVIQATTVSGSTDGSISAYAATGTSFVTNNGRLLASSTGSSTTYGISVTGGAAQITNTGSITSTAGAGTSSGIYAMVSGNIAIANSSAIQATSTSGVASAIYLDTPTGTGTVTNSGALTSMGSTNTYGIGAIGAPGDTQSYTITNSAAIQVTCTSSSGYFQAGGLYADGQNVQITNSGAITATATESHTYANAILGTGTTVTISNTGVLSATSLGGGSYGVFATGDTLTVGNDQAITATSTSGYAYGIYGRASDDVDVTNSGALTVRGGAASAGIAGISFNSNVSLTNSGPISVTASAYSASGLYAEATGGNIAVTNSSHVVATSQSGAYTASGIYAKAGTGTTTISNSGYAGGFNTNGGLGYGIDVDPTGPVVVNNTGTSIGTTAGIFLTDAGTVNNYGLASGGTYSIQVPTGSTVNLDGASPVLGLLKGGANDTSTSQLNFNIAIDGNRLTAEKAALNATIAQYNTALTNAVHGAGHDVDSQVVVLNNIDYQWEDFAGVADNLVQGRLYGATPGYSSEGSVLDNLPNNAASNTILNALGNVPDAGVAAALAELSPQQLEVFRNVAFDDNTFNVAKINNHLANRRDGQTGFDTSQLTVHDPTMDGTLDQVRSHLLAYNNPASSLGPISDSTQAMFGAMDMKDAKETKTSELATAPSDPWSTFIAGDVLLANLTNSTIQQNSNYTTGSVTAGFDYQLDDHFTVGALFSYSHTDATVDSRGSSATVDSYTPGLYASYVNKGWYANFLGAYSRNAYTSDRIVDIAGLAGDNHGGTNGNQGSANFTGGYEFQKGAFKFGPIASLQYVHLAVDAMQENGPTALSINSQSQDSLRSQFGFEGRFVTDVQTPVGPMTLTPHLSASWQHEYMDSSGGINAQFTGTGGGSFVTQTQPPDRDAAFIDAGLDANIGKNVTVFVDYETQAGQQNYFAQSAEGGVKIGF